MNKLETKVVFNQPGVKPVAAVIWLHGLGADFNDFLPIVAELKLNLALKFVFPNAPVMPVTINQGMHMRAWYDILDISDVQREVDSAGIVQSTEKIEQLIAELIAEGFQAEQIILAGFSQGGVICYYTALNSQYNLGGLVVLSAYLPDLSLLDVAKVRQKENLAILVCHGSQDPVINIGYGKQAVEALQQFGLTCQWHEYPMAHSVCMEEIGHVAHWLLRTLQKVVA